MLLNRKKKQNIAYIAYCCKHSNYSSYFKHNYDRNKRDINILFKNILGSFRAQELFNMIYV